MCNKRHVVAWYSSKTIIKTLPRQAAFVDSWPMTSTVAKCVIDSRCHANALSAFCICYVTLTMDIVIRRRSSAHAQLAQRWSQS